MDVTTDLLEQFNALQGQPYGARFFRADLHFHTPASEDARGRNRYNFNPYRLEYPQDDGSTDHPKAVKAIQERLLSEARAIAAKIVERFVEEGLSLVAVTDHNSIGTLWADSESDQRHMDLAAPTWYELIDREAQRRAEKEGGPPVTILPGVEISTTGVHILAIFPPQHPRRKIHFMICDLLNAAGFDMDAWGRNPKVGVRQCHRHHRADRRKGGHPHARTYRRHQPGIAGSLQSQQRGHAKRVSAPPPGRRGDCRAKEIHPPGPPAEKIAQPVHCRSAAG